MPTKESVGLDRIAALLLIIFILLKLTGIVDWTWWWLALILLANGIIAVIFQWDKIVGKE